MWSTLLSKNRWLHDPPVQGRRGVAIVTVLAILTVMALLAMSFAVLLMIEMEASRTSQGRVQSDMMAQSGLQHAMSLLRQDAVEQPGWDDRGDPGQQSAGRKWRLVYGGNGAVVGRYAFEIEDEAGKININAASACSTNEQNQGVGTFELLLTDGNGRGLPISTEMARRSVLYRYGRDGKPGRADIDDNLTASRYQCDEIDNNANGIVDEPGEGIDEPEEYSPINPRGDDRVFMSVSEMLDTCGSDTRMDDRSRIPVRRLATVDSRSRDMFMDDRDGTWQDRVNINVADKNQAMDVLTRANAVGQFEPVAKDLQQLGANILDYRDENHVLTTVGSEYGVEAICFNEVLAYDASWAQETDATDWGDYDQYLQPLSYNYFYNRHAGSAAQRWRIASVARSSGGMVLRLREPSASTDAQIRNFLKVDKHWPRDFWKNASMTVYNSSDKQLGTFTVTGNPDTAARELSIKCSPADASNITTTATVTIYTGWNLGYGGWCQDPERNETYFFHPPIRYPVNVYYQAIIGARYSYDNDWPALKSKEMDVDGDVTKYTETMPVHGKYLYKAGEAQKANAAGYLPITVTSSRRCKNQRLDFWNMLWGSYDDTTYFIRPDIVELINVSSRPISLRNWAVVVNTGKDAWELARLDKARRFSVDHGPWFDDPNPTIPANGYFYLTNNREIFSLEHASGNKEYGGNADETIPVYQIPQKSWGILYKVTAADWPSITVEGADWKKDQMAGEFIECVITRPWPNHDTADGVYKWATGNTRNTLTGIMDAASALKPGDYIRIMGLPRQGGFVSFTLKNEYNQVVARTLEYGSVDLFKFGYSTQKYDPTHYTWVPTATPTMGGTDRLARNMNMATAGQSQPHIKNNDYVSPAEIQNVRRSKDWENLGTQDAGVARRALRSIGAYVTVGGIRLEAEEEGAHVRGWKPAFATVRECTPVGVSVKDAQWPPGIWANSRLRVLSGATAGDEFVVTNNDVASLQIIGYSTAGSRPAAMKEGDRISIGPGYSTAFYYTRQDADVGEWEWKNKDIAPASYGLYLSGLNDSIVTTEFLEENWNAEIEAAVFNFRTRQYDPLPLENRSPGAFYRVRGSRGRVKYGKNDLVFCGMIGPDHISAYRGIRLKLVPHSTGQKNCSGFAWFDYAYLAPGQTVGKININTAPAPVLSSLPGVPLTLATCIAKGTGDGARLLKPYRTIGDILEVQGMTPEIFTRICNLITTASDQYRVKVVGQAVAPQNVAQTTTNDQRVVAESRLDVLLDRSALASERGQGSMFHVSTAR